MRPPYDAALVLGVELDADDAPTEELARRVMAAAQAYRGGACASLVLCGGCLPGHRRSEAEVMARMLAALGVPKRVLIWEDQSRDTMENCRNAAALLGGTGRVLVVTSDYHLRRAVMTARRAGLRADGLAAKTTGGRVGRLATSRICCSAGRTRAGRAPRGHTACLRGCSANRQKNKARRSELSIAY